MIRFNFQFDFSEILKICRFWLIFKFSEFSTSWILSVFMGNYTTEPPVFEQRILQARNAHQTTNRRQQYLRNLIQLNVSWIFDDCIDKLLWWDHFPSPVGPPKSCSNVTTEFYTCQKFGSEIDQGFEISYIYTHNQFTF